MAEGMVTIKIPADTKHIKQAISKILGALNGRRISDDVIFDIRLCAEEAIKNAILHGDKGNSKLSVRISYAIAADKISIEVEDEGTGFDHKNSPDPTKEDNLMKTSGRGVYLIKKLMDSAEYNDAGNKITMIKRFK